MICRKHLNNVFVVLGSVLVLTGASSVDLTDIEAEILKKNFKQAELLANQFLQTGQDKSKTHQGQYYLGLSLLQQSQPTQAREVFEKIQTGNPTADVLERAGLGIVDSWFMEGKYDTAKETVEQLLKDHPQSSQLSLMYLKLARAHLKMAHWKKASGYLEKIVKEFPESPEQHTARQLLEEKYFFAVQVGAYTERSLAQELVSELKNKGEYSYIVETTDALGNPLYRVRVGELALLTDAQKLRDKLTQSGYSAAIYP